MSLPVRMAPTRAVVAAAGPTEEHQVPAVAGARPTPAPRQAAWPAASSWPAVAAVAAARPARAAVPAGLPTRTARTSRRFPTSAGPRAPRAPGAWAAPEPVTTATTEYSATAA